MLTPNQITSFTKVSLTQAPYCLLNLTDDLIIIAHNALLIGQTKTYQNAVAPLSPPSQRKDLEKHTLG